MKPSTVTLTCLSLLLTSTAVASDVPKRGCLRSLARGVRGWFGQEQPAPVKIQDIQLQVNDMKNLFKDKNDWHLDWDYFEQFRDWIRDDVKRGRLETIQWNVFFPWLKTAIVNDNVSRDLIGPSLVLLKQELVEIRKEIAAAKKVAKEKVRLEELLNVKKEIKLCIEILNSKTMKK